MTLANKRTKKEQQPFKATALLEKQCNEKYTREIY